MATTGYSNTPLYKKLGLKAGFRVKPLHAPDNYAALIGPMADEVTFDAVAIPPVDVVHLFTNSARELEDVLPLLKAQLKKNGAIWVSWYKKSSGKRTELSDVVVREIALECGLVDVKVCAVDEVWSGLKLVVPVEER